MKKHIMLLTLWLLTSLAMQVSAQLINLNPDPNGEPWYAGGLPEITPERQAELDAIPLLTLTAKSLSTALPAMGDNSKKIWFRPIFGQDGGSCGQASGIGYLFTYEVNRVRDLPANNPNNQYPTHYTWNYLNFGGNTGSWYNDGWDIVNNSGIPTVASYNGLWKPISVANGRWKIWETGYEKYNYSLENRVINSYHSIDVSTPEGLETLKHWINDHGVGDDTGGLANFAAVMPHPTDGYGLLPAESAESGKKIILQFGHKGYHAMTIVGYNDNIKFDFNNDGQFTNPEDNMAEWEIGALKVANSWGTSYPGSGPVNPDGFVYMPYRLLAQGSGSIKPNVVHVLKVKEKHTPKVTVRVKLNHPVRNKLTINTGLAENLYAVIPTHRQIYHAYYYKRGGALPMQGNNNEPIEIELDVTAILNIVPEKFFLDIDNKSNNTGQILEFTLVDYDTNDGIPIEIPYSVSEFPVYIMSNETTLLSIKYDYFPTIIDKPITLNRNFTTNKNSRIVAGGNLIINANNTLTIPYDKSLTAESGGKISIKSNGELVLHSSSTINISIGSSLIVERGGTLVIEDCAILKQVADGSIIIEDGGILCIHPNAILDVSGHSAIEILGEITIPQGFIHPYDIVPPTYKVPALSGTHNWSVSNYKMQRDLIIEADAKLNLNTTTLEFAEGKGIIVNKGALLEVNGGKLKALQSCNDSGLWSGILVKGDKFLPQSPVSNQGYLKISNGAIISHAEIGVHIANFPAGSSGGGVIDVSDATFIDNRIAISFARYISNEPNASGIRNSNFINTDYFSISNKYPEYFILLDNVPMVKISSNTFINSSPESYAVEKRGYGIYSTNSDLVFMGKGAHNTFSNLFTAIHSIGTSSVTGFYAEDLDIENCFNGIHINGILSPIIKRCNISVVNEVLLDKVPSAISLSFLSDFSLDNNLLSGQGIGYGIHLTSIDESGGRGRVLSNHITGFNYGIMARGSKNNQNTIKVFCNTFSNNITADILDLDIGISQIQGSNKISASNMFNNTPTWNIYTAQRLTDNNTIIFPMVYYAYNGNYYPRLTHNVFTQNATSLAGCAPATNNVSLRLGHISQAQDSVWIVENILQTLYDMGKTPNLLELIKNARNPIALRNSLISHSPFLSDTVLLRATESQVLPNILLSQVVSANAHAPKSGKIMKAVKNRNPKMQNHLLDDIYESGNQISPIDELNAEISHLKATRDMITGKLLSAFATDTIAKQYDSIQMIQFYHPAIIYRYISAFADFEQGRVAEAISSLEQIIISPEISYEQQQVAEGVKQVILLLNQLSEAEVPITEIDDSSREAFMLIVSNYTGLASQLAENVLLIADKVPFLAEDIIITTSSSSEYNDASEGDTLIQNDENLGCPTVSIYPNPTDGKITIYIHGCKDIKHFNYEIISQKGAALISGTSSVRKNVSLDGLPTGTYIVKVEIDSKIYSKTIILK
ncbi:MAG: T9SS type A sorting domain-containing protein [Bacteroidetes bacterium]|nr:T9SS type A sorting domain-containing protein [Bacteroidota bacterium]